MRKRAEQVEQARQRTIDATVELHTTVGPADTTISGIAERAGVTRLTVYRHFPDLDSLYAACTHRWTSQHPGPDPAAWLRISDHDERVRRALRELYGWYREHVDDLYPLYRDVDTWPETAQRAAAEEAHAWADALVTGSGVRGYSRRRRRAAAGHVTSFWTWHSLTVDQSLTDREAAGLAEALLMAAAGLAEAHHRCLRRARARLRAEVSPPGRTVLAACSWTDQWRALRGRASVGV